MAGLINGKFINKVSDHLQNLMDEQKRIHGVDSNEYQALYRQFVYTPAECLSQQETNSKHYEACVDDSSGLPTGIERLYRRQIVIDLTMLCAAHCRYCLRANYEYTQLNHTDIDAIVKYISTDPDLKEILVTGGDPFIVPALLKYLISEIAEKAKNIKIVRIGTRLPVHSPLDFDEDFPEFFKRYSGILNFEVACQINHPVELTPETKSVLKSLRENGVTLYAQNVLLKGVNDSLETLADLYDQLRYLNIEAHYLFHSIPMKGTHHLRTSVKKGLDLIRQLSSSGLISGRAKPSFSLMTYIGKVTLYEGSIIKNDNGILHIKTSYTVEDRIRWNPTYSLPDSNAYISEDGSIVALYLDGSDD